MTSLVASKTLYFHAGGPGLTPGQETGSHRLQLRSGALKQFSFKWLHLKHSAWHDLMRVCVSFPTFVPLDMRHDQSLSHVWLYDITTRLLWPWNFSDKNTGVGCQVLLQGINPIEGSNSLLQEQADSTTAPPGEPRFPSPTPFPTPAWAESRIPVVKSALKRNTCQKDFLPLLHCDPQPAAILDTRDESLKFIPAPCPRLGLVAGTLLAVWCNSSSLNSPRTFRVEFCTLNHPTI